LSRQRWIVVGRGVVDAVVAVEVAAAGADGKKKQVDAVVE
jgi:hypothetical protein